MTKLIMSIRVFDPPNEVWEAGPVYVKKVAQRDFKSITTDTKMIAFFKLYDNGTSLIILEGFGSAASYLKHEFFPHARLVRLVPPVVNMPGGKRLTIEECILYSINRK